MGTLNYVNRQSSIGHDTRISDFNNIGPGCRIAGRCQIGSKNYFGIGSILIDALKIKDEITIGAGGVVIENLLLPGTYVGVPAKKIK